MVKLRMRLQIYLIASLVSLAATVNAEIRQFEYTGFTVWVDCERKGAVMFDYVLQMDIGNHTRSSSFYLDPNAEGCQQLSTDSYKNPNGDGRTYDRGHLVPANHMDHSKESILQTNFMTNILPQAANMNRGAWLQTEVIADCWRDEMPLRVMGGVIWGDDERDDYFVKSHGIATPDAFWKVIQRYDAVIAWLIPNSANATKRRLDKYLISVSDLEKRIGMEIPVQPHLKDETPFTSWHIPSNCDRS